MGEHLSIRQRHETSWGHPFFIAAVLRRLVFDHAGQTNSPCAFRRTRPIAFKGGAAEAIGIGAVALAGAVWTGAGRCGNWGYGLGTGADDKLVGETIGPESILEGPSGLVGCERIKGSNTAWASVAAAAIRGQNVFVILGG